MTAPLVKGEENDDVRKFLYNPVTMIKMIYLFPIPS